MTQLNRVKKPLMEQRTKPRHPAWSPDLTGAGPTWYWRGRHGGGEDDRDERDGEVHGETEEKRSVSTGWSGVCYILH